MYQGNMPSELAAVDIQIKTSDQIQRENNANNVRNQLKVNHQNIEEEDEYDDEDYLDEDYDENVRQDHLTKPIGK